MEGPKLPKLRNVDRISSGGSSPQQVVVRDPLGVADSFALDATFGRVLDLLDGTRSVAQVRQSMLMRGGQDIDLHDLTQFVAGLSDAGWLEDDAFRTRWQATHHDFIAAQIRTARFAGLLYPSSQTELRAALEATLGPAGPRTISNSKLCGVLVPHGPLELVGPTVDLALQGLPRAQDIDLVVVIGTDHAVGLTPYAVTAKTFETPLGQVAGAPALVAALERRVPWILREQIRHRDAVSIELATVLLQYLYGDKCPPMLALLCGQGVFAAGAETPPELALASVEALTEDRRVLWWGSAELSHGGPAYGRPALSDADRNALHNRDRACLDSLARGRREQLRSRCTEAGPQGVPSGGAVMTTLASLLPSGTRMRLASYTTKTIPGKDDGIIGLAGVRFEKSRA